MERTLYLADLQRHQVSYTKGEDGTFTVRGLPVIREGTWNRFPFTPAHLDSIVERFQEDREQLGFEPPLRPYHAKDGEPIDVRHDTLGHITALRREGDTLLADATVFDEATIGNLQTGRFRYTSAEVPYTQTGPGTRLRALAFVDNPAVKGLPWTLVCNSDEFPGGREAEEDTPPEETVATAPPPALPEPQGGESHTMTLRERIEAYLERKPTATKEEVIAELQEEPAEVVALREQAEAADAARLAAEAEVVALREAEAQRATAEAQAAVAGQVNALLSERRIVPAQQDRLTVLLSALAGQELTVTLAEGATEQRDLAGEVVALLREGAVIGEKYFAQTSTDGPSEADLAAVAERMAAAAGAAPAE